MWVSQIKERWHYKWEYERQLNECRKEESEILAREPHNEDPTIGSWVKDCQKNDQRRRMIVTRYLRFKADRLGAQVPSTDEHGIYERVEWDDDPSEPYYLTDAGVRLLRDRIRQEEKYRTDKVAFWVTSLVSISGALIGVISVMRN
jgi:hypothetical protein